MSAPVESSGPGGIPKECHGLWGMLFGHKFKARYDTQDKSTGPPQPALDRVCATYDPMHDDLESVILAVGRAYGGEESVYVHDVCVRCGMVINRN